MAELFLTFYSGGTKEEIGNYAVLIKSYDGIHFSEPIDIADTPNMIKQQHEYYQYSGGMQFREQH